MIKFFLVGFLALSTLTASVSTVDNSVVLGKGNTCPKTELCQTLPQCNQVELQKEDACCATNTSCENSKECVTCPPTCPPTPSCPCVCE